MSDPLFTYKIRNDVLLPVDVRTRIAAPLPKLILLLSGILTAENRNGIEVGGKKNYFIQNFPPVDEGTFAGLSRVISDDLTQDDLENYFKKRAYSHFQFFKTLCDELTYCIFLIETEQYTSAFINLYRAIEAVSFSFPSIYIASSDDFIGGYKYFQGFFKDSGSEAGELAFFRHFIKTAMQGDSLLETDIEFQLDADPAVGRSIINQLKRATEGNIEFEINENVINIKFVDIFSFLIIIRNRYFHNNKSGQANMSIEGLVDPEILFRAITERSIFAICAVLLMIIQRQVALLR